jgi:hypothetical protein
VNAEGLGHSVVEARVSGIFYGVNGFVIVARDYYCDCRIFQIRRSLFGFYGSNSFITHQMGELTAEAERQYQMRMDTEKELQELKQQKSTGPDSGVPELQIANVCIERLVGFWPLHLPDFFLIWSFPAFGKIAIPLSSSVVCHEQEDAGDRVRVVICSEAIGKPSS